MRRNRWLMVLVGALLVPTLGSTSALAEPAPSSWYEAPVEVVTGYDQVSLTSSSGNGWAIGHATELSTIAEGEPASVTRSFVTSPDGAISWLEPGFDYSGGINDFGQVAGARVEAPGQPRRATIWKAGNYHDIGPDPLIGQESKIVDINDVGEALGYFQTASTAAFFVVGSDLVPRLIPTTFNGEVVQPRRILESGLMFGYSTTYPFRAFVSDFTDAGTHWVAAGPGDLPEGFSIQGFDVFTVNASGTVAGIVRVGNDFGVDDRLYRWDRAHGFEMLDELLASPENLPPISENGDVAVILHRWPEGRPVLWKRDGSVVDIEAFGGRTFPPTIVNHFGFVAMTTVVGAQLHSAVWTPTTGTIDLDPLGVESRVAAFTERNAIFSHVLLGRDEFDRQLSTLVLRRPRYSAPQVHWSATEYARIQQLMTHYGMSYDELTKFGVYVAAFINGIDPSPVPTPITVAPPGTAQTQTITWHPDEIALLETVKQRWVLDDEGAHRWGFMLLSFIATLQGA